MEDKEMVLSLHTLCTYLCAICIYIPGLSAIGGQGNYSLRTFLDSLLVEDREMLLSVHTWAHCWLRTRNRISVHTWTLCGWRTWRWFSLYEPRVSASGWQGNTYPSNKYLDSLLMEKMEMVLSGRTWTHCWWSIWREFSLYKPGLSAGRGEGIGSFCTTWTLC